MRWDTGGAGLALLAALSVAMGLVAGTLVGDLPAHRLNAAALTTGACFAAAWAMTAMRRPRHEHHLRSGQRRRSGGRPADGSHGAPPRR